MIEVLCARSPAVIRCCNLKTVAAFYRSAWGFTTVQAVPGVMALLTRESVTVHLWQRRADETRETWACRLLVDRLATWHAELVSAPGQAAASFADQPWGREWRISDCEGNRLALVQSAPHAVRAALAALPPRSDRKLIWPAPRR